MEKFSDASRDMKRCKHDLDKKSRIVNQVNTLRSIFKFKGYEDVMIILSRSNNISVVQKNCGKIVRNWDKDKHHLHGCLWLAAWMFLL